MGTWDDINDAQRDARAGIRTKLGSPFYQTAYQQESDRLAGQGGAYTPSNQKVDVPTWMARTAIVLGLAGAFIGAYSAFEGHSIRELGSVLGQMLLRGAVGFLICWLGSVVSYIMLRIFMRVLIVMFVISALLGLGLLALNGLSKLLH